MDWMGALQVGHGLPFSLHAFAHDSQNWAWPHGTSVKVFGASIQIIHSPTTSSEIGWETISDALHAWLLSESSDSNFNPHLHLRISTRWITGCFTFFTLCCRTSTGGISPESSLIKLSHNFWFVTFMITHCSSPKSKGSGSTIRNGFLHDTVTQVYGRSLTVVWNTLITSMPPLMPLLVASRTWFLIKSLSKWPE